MMRNYPRNTKAHRRIQKNTRELHCLKGFCRSPLRAATFQSVHTKASMRQLKALLKQQHKDLDELATEVQRKEITPDRVIRFMKIVQRNVEICERIVALMERGGITSETSEESKTGFRTPLQ